MTFQPSEGATHERNYFDGAAPYSNQVDAFNQDLGHDKGELLGQPESATNRSLNANKLFNGDGSLESRARMLQASLNSGEMPGKSNDPLTLDMLGPGSKDRSR